MLRNTEEQVPMLKEGEVQQSQGLLREESVAQDLGSPIGGSNPSFSLQNYFKSQHWIFTKIWHLESNTSVSIFNMYVPINFQEKKDC